MAVANRNFDCLLLFMGVTLMPVRREQMTGSCFAMATMANRILLSRQNLHGRTCPRTTCRTAPTPNQTRTGPLRGKKEDSMSDHELAELAKLNSQSCRG